MRQLSAPAVKETRASPGPFERVRRFVSYPRDQRFLAVASRWQRWFPWLPLPLRLKFGAWWLAEKRGIDHYLVWSGFEEPEVSFVGRFLQRGMTFVDVGAHRGLYTLLASKRVGESGRVIAFEPSPRERIWLKCHAFLNFCSNARIESFAVGSRREKADLFVVDGAENWGNSLRPPAVDGATHKVSVDVLSLDDYMEESRLGSVDFVKLDVEGAEREVLRGARRLLNQLPRPLILTEVYDIRTEPWGYPAREIVQFLTGLGFAWFRLLPDGALARIGADRDVYDANLVAVPEERIGQITRFLGQSVGTKQA